MGKQADMILVRHHSNLTSDISAIVAGIASNSAIAYYSSTIRVINATSKGRR